MNARVYEQSRKLRDKQIFVEEETLIRLDNMSSLELDQLGFGVIGLSDDGTVLEYNQYEQDLAQRQKEDVIGASFFTEVAPCSNKPVFAGLFFYGVQQKEMDCMISYFFNFNMIPTHVWVHMYRSPITQKNWILVQRK